MKIIDIIRTSASRPDYLKESTENLQKMLKFDGKFRWIIHEDNLNKNLSKQCADYINECGIYDLNKIDTLAIGQGPSLTWLLEQTKSEYVINFEDDFKLLKEVNINALTDLMDIFQDMNQIAFHKRPIMHMKKGTGGNPNFYKKAIIRNNIQLVTNPHWSFTPSIFRASFLKSKWRNFNNNVHWQMNQVLKGYKTLGRDSDWVIANTGTYFLGSIKNKKMKIENGGIFSPEEYEKIDNGFYSYHLGQGDGSVRLGRYGK